MKARINKFRLNSRWRLALKILPITLTIVLLKVISFKMEWEFLSLSSLFTALISANIFLIGFLVTGTLSDYKESEKLPGDMASSLLTMADEGLIIQKAKNSKEATSYLKKLHAFNVSILDWFHGKKETKVILDDLKSFNEDFLLLEGQAQATFIARLKQEQNFLRKVIARVHTIRSTSFLSTGYVIAELITFATTVGLIFIKIQKDLRESMFFTAFVSYILIYMIYFIKDLDNPFGYVNDPAVVDEVSLAPLVVSEELLRRG